ncbi:Chloride channel protein CLC-a, partial [Mucuna pruriens]
MTYHGSLNCLSQGLGHCLRDLWTAFLRVLDIAWRVFRPYLSGSWTLLRGSLDRLSQGLGYCLGIIGSIGAVSASLDLGKEGPLGGPDNYRIKWRWFRYFNNERDHRDLITCGASLGVCAAFWAPVGGVLFALEEVATWWRSALLWRTFFSTAVVVVVMLRAFVEICHSGKCGLVGEGGLIIFDVSNVTVIDVSNVTVRYHVMDIVLLVVIGIIGGVLGSLYNHVLHKILRLYNLINQ